MKCSNDFARTAPRGRIAGLIALNAALLVALGAVMFSPNADAQVRPRGSYTMAAGGANGVQADVVYVVDTINEELIAISWEPNQKELLGIGYRSLARDKSQLPRASR